MKRYLISANVNAGKKFTPAEWLHLGVVEAKNKIEALDKAQRNDFNERYFEDFNYSRNFPFRVTTNIQL